MDKNEVLQLLRDTLQLEVTTDSDIACKSSKIWIKLKLGNEVLSEDFVTIY